MSSLRVPAQDEVEDSEVRKQKIAEKRGKCASRRHPYENVGIHVRGSSGRSRE